MIETRPKGSSSFDEDDELFVELWSCLQIRFLIRRSASAPLSQDTVKLISVRLSDGWAARNWVAVAVSFSVIVNLTRHQSPTS